MVGLTLVLIATVLYGVVTGVRFLWPRRRKRSRAHREAVDRAPQNPQPLTWIKKPLFPQR